ncbi:MAG: ribosome maturation factor RimP [Clostridiales bacterium]|nr:ribosome maturation factor RimP [Clostridiales bacterium]
MILRSFALRIVEAVKELAGPIVERYGCELWDVEYVKEAGEWYLRVFIDKDGGVSINDCEAVSVEMDPLLDQKDLIPNSYTFEVSSAGAERQLKKPADFERSIGKNVTVRLFAAKDNVKEHEGKLLSYSDGTIEIESKGKKFSFDKSEYSLVRLRIDF